MADYKYNPPSRSSPPTEKKINDTETSGRIYNVFPATIVLDELSLADNRKSGTTDNTSIKSDDTMSSLLPIIKINDYIFTASEISYIDIDSTKKIPTVQLSISMTMELFMTRNLPKDGDIMSIMIKSKSEVLKPIRNDYLITGVLSPNRDTEKSERINMTFYGELFIPGMQSYMKGFNKKGTSMECMKAIAKVLNLGFNTNENATDDFQFWIMKDNFFQIIDDICERAWLNENSYWDWWVDVYYNINFINIQKILLTKEEDIDKAAAINNSNTELDYGGNETDNNIIPKIFSNMSEIRNTSSFIQKWSPNNSSSSITHDYGLTLYCDVFEHNNLLYANIDKKKYWSIEVNPMYDVNKVNTHIILRGRPYWDASINTDQSARTNYDYNELYKKHTWAGIQYTLSNPSNDVKQWNGNHHKNYERAKVQNILNNVELDKLSITIQVTGVNLNVIRGDKLPIVITKKDLMEQKFNTDGNSQFSMDRFYSGWYYVKGFTISWSRSNNNELKSKFSQSFILSRREWPTPVPTIEVK